MRAAPNKPAALRWMGVTLYGEAVPAGNYGMIGRALKKYDLEYLASLLWQNAARPPNGDPFKYVLGVAKGRSTVQSRHDQSMETLEREMEKIEAEKRTIEGSCDYGGKRNDDQGFASIFGILDAPQGVDI